MADIVLGMKDTASNQEARSLCSQSYISVSEIEIAATGYVT